MKHIFAGLLLWGTVMAQAQICNDELQELTHLNQSDVRKEIAIPGFDQYPKELSEKSQAVMATKK